MNHVRPQGYPTVPLSTVTGSTGFISDGDWVESKDQDPNGDVRLIQLADVGVGTYVDKSARFLTSEKAKKLRCTFLHSGDILVARMPDPIGRACIFPGDAKQAVTVVDVCVIRPDPAYCDARWLCWTINSPQFLERVQGLARGATRQRIARTELEKILIAIPPLPEQKRIAAILDQTDALRAKRREALAKLDEMAQAIFVEMFGDTSLEGHRIPLEPLGKHLSFVTSGGRNWARFYTEKGLRFIRSLDVRMNKIASEDAVFVSPPDNAEAKRTRVRTGDVLLTITGSCIGRVTAVGREHDGAHISQHVAILRPQKTILPEYLSYYLSLPDGGQVQVSRLQYGQTKPGLNFEQIRRFEIPVPSLQAQKAFMARLEQLDALRERQSAGEGKLDALFTSLQHRAFSGEL